VIRYTPEGRSAKPYFPCRSVIPSMASVVRCCPRTRDELDRDAGDPRFVRVKDAVLIRVLEYDTGNHTVGRNLTEDQAEPDAESHRLRARETDVHAAVDSPGESRLSPPISSPKSKKARDPACARRGSRRLPLRTVLVITNSNGGGMSRPFRSVS